MDLCHIQSVRNPPNLKVPSDGSERGPVRLTKGTGFNAVESVDGQTVYFSRERTASGVWKIAAAGGEEQQSAISGLRCTTAILLSGETESTTSPRRNRNARLIFSCIASRPGNRRESAG